MKKLFLGLTAIAMIASCSSKQTQLELNLTKGATYTQNLAINSDIEQEMMGQKMQMQMNMSADINFLVKDLQNDVYEMTTEYNNMSITVSSAMGNITISSDDTDKSNPMAVAVNNIVHKPFTVFMKKDGSIQSVSGISDIMASMFAGLDSLTDMEKQQLTAQLKDSWGDEAFKNNFDMTSSIYPTSGKAAINTPWKRDMSIKSVVNINSDIEYTLTETTADYNHIIGKGTISSNIDTSLSGTPAKIAMNGDLELDIKIDPTTGWITTTTIKQNIGGDIKISADGQDMSIPINTKSTITMTGSEQK